MVDGLYPRRKKIRIDRTAYAVPGAVCTVTIATLERCATFRDIALTDACVALLETQARSTGVLVHVYCFMPDHLHLLLSPSASTSIFDFVGAYKSLSTRVAWQHGHTGRLWQGRFFDQFLRRDDNVRHVVDYIVHNPVRAGMVENWRDYPFVGSLVYDL